MRECRLHLSDSGQPLMADFREHSKQLSGSTKRGIFRPFKMLSFQESVCPMQLVESLYRVVLTTKCSEMRFCFKPVHMHAPYK
jgi:hypothetical protein